MDASDVAQQIKQLQQDSRSAQMKNATSKADTIQAVHQYPSSKLSILESRHA